MQLQSTDPTALSDWLTANGFAIPADIEPIIAAYVQGGFDFLALKLQPGQDVQAMRPVSVTSPGASLTLPLRMVAAGTGATVGVTLWVLGDGRYEAANFPNFIIDPRRWSGTGVCRPATTPPCSSRRSPRRDSLPGKPRARSACRRISWRPPFLDDDASTDYEAIPASDAGDGGAGETAEEVRQKDLTTLFPGGDQSTVVVTRLRADLAHAALANDLVLQASADQSNVSNVYRVTQSTNAPACAPVPNPCPPCSGNGDDDAGVAGSLGGGSSTKGATPGQQSFGCSAVASPARAGWLELTLASVLGLSLVRSRVRRKR